EVQTGAAATGPASERIALYVFPGDYERRGLTHGAGFAAGTYVAPGGALSESQYLVGGARVVWKPGDPALGLDRDHRITFNTSDLLGTTTAVIDLVTGELTECSTYYPGGARETYLTTTDAELQPEPMGFTSKEGDEEVGLVYFGERYLIPRIARWASPDPAAIHGLGGGEAINSYHYVAGNLLQARDPEGLVLAIAIYDTGRGRRMPLPSTPNLPATADSPTIRTSGVTDEQADARIAEMRGSISNYYNARISSVQSDTSRPAEDRMRVVRLLQQKSISEQQNLFWHRDENGQAVVEISIPSNGGESWILRSVRTLVRDRGRTHTVGVPGSYNYETNFARGCSSRIGGVCARGVTYHDSDGTQHVLVSPSRMVPSTTVHELSAHAACNINGGGAQCLHLAQSHGGPGYQDPDGLIGPDVHSTADRGADALDSARGAPRHDNAVPGNWSPEPDLEFLPREGIAR
ncbi:MAG: hypothetical protein GXP55_04150, partial [Deltaproteobacteria bacterium]|nr:hypothetical protein [Deltaproteobacteria bacterium]